MLSHFILLRHSDDGMMWIFFILILAFSGDIAAFYVGRSVGKRKLMPAGKSGQDCGGNGGIADRKRHRLRIVPAIVSSRASGLSCRSAGIFGRNNGTTGRPLRVRYQESFRGKGFRFPCSWTRGLARSAGLFNFYCAVRLLL